MRGKQMCLGYTDRILGLTHTVPSLAGVQVKEYQKFQSQLCTGVLRVIETTEELDNSNPLTQQLWPGRPPVHPSHFNL